MQVEISSEERDVLKRILESALGEMKAEVRRSSTHKYHDQLKLEEGHVQALLGKLGSGE